jgi:hypothetical protein
VAIGDNGGFSYLFKGLTALPRQAPMLWHGGLRADVARVRNLAGVIL